MILDSMLTLSKLKKNVRRPRHEIDGIQQVKLRALMHHAYANVPYYRKLFDSVRIKPDDIKTVGDLRNIPTTDKSTMRSLDKGETVARNINLRECVEVFTSGSTGMPSHIHLTRDDHALLDLVYLRSFLENGLAFSHKRAFLLDPHSFDAKRRWYQRLGFAKAVHVSCFLDPEEQLRLLERERPDFLHGYPSSLGQISRLILENGGTGIRPTLVSTAAELLRDRDRELITAAFGVPPYDRYAARECGNIAWQCEHRTGYHINMDTVVVEFLEGERAVAPGQRGDVVVTNLHSYAMPFIRYRIGDLGVPSDRACPCGRTFPLMEIIEGRDEDFILLKGGRTVSPMVITGTLDHIPGIRQFRVIQEREDLLLAVLARGTGFNADTVSHVERELKGIVGLDVVIRCEATDYIPRESSGKLRAVISRLS